LSQFALAAVAVVALGGGARALTELAAVSQLWTTSYGRALLVKTAIFAALLVLAWLGRRRFLFVQLGLLVVLGVAVGALTDLRPGRARSAVASAQAKVALPPSPPPAGAYVDGGRAAGLAAGSGWLAGKGKGPAVGQDGNVGDDVPVRVAGSSRIVRGAVAGRTLRFAVPPVLRPALAALRRARRLY